MKDTAVLLEKGEGQSYNMNTCCQMLPYIYVSTMSLMDNPNSVQFIFTATSNGCLIWIQKAADVNSDYFLYSYFQLQML